VWTYFDTSALVKRYVDEPGRREVLQLLKQNECVTSAVLPVELRSGLRRRVAEGSIDATRLPAILKHVAADRRYWTLVEVGTDVLAGAERLVAAHPIRTLEYSRLRKDRSPRGPALERRALPVSFEQPSLDQIFLRLAPRACP
jgi:hypothetical protein